MGWYYSSLPLGLFLLSLVLSKRKAHFKPATTVFLLVCLQFFCLAISEYHLQARGSYRIVVATGLESLKLKVKEMADFVSAEMCSA